MLSNTFKTYKKSSELGNSTLYVIYQALKWFVFFFLDVELAVYYLKACNIVENIQGTDEWKKITLSFSK